MHAGQRPFEPVEPVGERAIARSRLELEHRLLRRRPFDRVHDPSLGYDASPGCYPAARPALNT